MFQDYVKFRVLTPKRCLHGAFGDYYKGYEGLRFPKIGVTFLGVPKIMIIVFGSLYWGYLIQGLGLYRV